MADNTKDRDKRDTSIRCGVWSPGSYIFRAACVGLFPTSVCISLLSYTSRDPMPSVSYTAMEDGFVRVASSVMLSFGPPFMYSNQVTIRPAFVCTALRASLRAHQLKVFIFVPRLSSDPFITKHLSRYPMRKWCMKKLGLHMVSLYTSPIHTGE